MRQTNPSRRELLQFSGAALGASTLAGLAGCIGEVPLGGTEGGSGGNSQFVDWLYEPGEVADIDHYFFFHSDLEKIRQHEDRLDEGLYDDFEQMEDTFSGTDIDFDEMSTYLSYRNASITAGSYSTDDITSALEDDDFDDDTEHEGYTIYLSADEERAVGVSNQALVTSTSISSEGVIEGAPDVVETIIDTHLGTVDRYAEENDDLKTLTSSLDVGAHVSGRTYEAEETTDVSMGTFENSVAGGARWRINGETSKIKRIIVFEEEDDVDTDDVDEWVGEYQGSDQTFDDVDDTTVEQNGRTAVVTSTIDTDDVTGNEI